MCISPVLLLLLTSFFERKLLFFSVFEIRNKRKNSNQKQYYS
ncbi:hypothetical protein electrica_02892 [Klebsiella electrica]|nr:hypothetical protein electrica_02892 [Klebsiella electrica]BBV76785.1 hypothetical protein STW0522RAO56_28390 [Raoultella planticola]